MLYLATGQWGYVAGGLALFGLAGAAGAAVSQRVATRIAIWLSPWPDAAGRAFQIVQSLIAFGEGGILGAGLGLGRPIYIPAVHTDFVFAAVAEEFGLLGTVALVAPLRTPPGAGVRTALQASRPFEQFLAAGLTAGLGIQAWTIMAANARLVPIAGVTLPFLSYGGSSLLATFVAVGLLLRISADGARAGRAADLARPLRILGRGSWPGAGRPDPGLRLLARPPRGLAGCPRWTTPRRVEGERRIVRGRFWIGTGRCWRGWRWAQKGT